MSKQTLNEWLDELNQYKIDLGLDRLKRVLGQLNLKQLDQQVVTVGGTNGKGSTVAALCSLLTTQSLSFGAFTSPHIFKFNERININGQLATDDEVIQAFNRIEQARVDINLSYFEFAFLAALLIFVAHDVDVMVIGVGLGGRLDAANVLDADATIITTVAIDHTEWLGDDIESIAAEKAGIMRPGQVTVYGDEKAPEAIKTKAADTGARLLRLSQDYQLLTNNDTFSYSMGSHVYEDLPKPQLKGDWQIKNFGSALSALLGLNYQFTHIQLVQAITQTKIDGRLQTMGTSPEVLADVAHNKQAVENLAGWLKKNPVQGHTRAVFSVLKDKEVGDWLGLLDEVIDHWFTFELPGERAMEMPDLLEALTEQVALITRCESGQAAYQMALTASNNDDRILVFGSFHVLDEVFK